MENLEAMVDQYTHIFNLRKNAGPSTVFSNNKGSHLSKSVKEVVGWIAVLSGEGFLLVLPAILCHNFKGVIHKNN